MALDSWPLREVLDDVATGHIQLPDFQREWKWDDERIVSILATVTMNYPMGVIMTLETGGPGGEFKARPVAGVEVLDGRKPGQLLLDGQQRMTSLYQALRSGRPVDTEDQRGDKLRQWYYIEIAKAIDPKADRESAIRSVPESKIIPARGKRPGLDLTTRELECEQGFFPLHLVFDSDETEDWQWIYNNSGGPERREAWKAFRKAVLENVIGYAVPMIRLEKRTPKVAVCTVFEKVNTGGVALNVFELLTASFAGDSSYSTAHGEDFHLPKDWADTKARLSAAYPVLSSLESTDFLQAVCLAATYHKDGAAVSCKRRDMLELKLDEYLKWAPEIADALQWAGGFLADQCVYYPEGLPYRTQLPPLAAIRTILGAETDTPEARAKLARWYWCGVFGEQYGGTADSRFPRDVEQVTAWLRGGEEPDSVQEARFVVRRLLSMTSRVSAAYKGVFALLLQQGCTDWYYNDKPLTSEQIADYKVDIYRVFPTQWCKKNGIDSSRCDSVVNKTLLSYRAAKAIGTRSPAVGLKALERETGIRPNWLDDVVVTHFIDPQAVRASDFDAFFEARKEELVRLIERAMGQRAVRNEAEGLV
ncbi:DUF262 domain-containing protein [Thermomonospora cellulosilytica]|uniref:GmrSD restriction endonucleases N-terminal domain-containing protein n=1 Tax=Thermomonospora cellulosilytica TaxID=1411118 RepID=A0A7W3R9Q5_9ACTN|nr:DUF262 domain-containing protein [Thermomonospora cellulosilytica]MBA9005011.1 hypothetical protein [Thermomonospora cellulosilytica]